MRYKTKIKRYLKKNPKTNFTKAVLILFAVNLLIFTAIITNGIQTEYALADVEVPNKEELPIKAYIRQEVERVGLSWNEVNCLIEHESGWSEWAQGVNNNHTTDSGIFQINSVHKNTISLEDRFDYKKATTWAINKRLHDGNWNAWYGYKYNCK